jgi:hypothetical protein
LISLSIASSAVNSFNTLFSSSIFISSLYIAVGIFFLWRGYQ